MTNLNTTTLLFYWPQERRGYIVYTFPKPSPTPSLAPLLCPKQSLSHLFCGTGEQLDKWHRIDKCFVWYVCYCLDYT